MLSKENPVPGQYAIMTDEAGLLAPRTATDPTISPAIDSQPDSL